MCWTDEASDQCWEGVRIGFRAVGLLESPPPLPLPLPLRDSAALLPPGSAPAQASLRR